MIALYTALALLGLSAIDPVGIGVMPILLVQKRPHARVFAFLGGSFTSLVAMGVVFAAGLGRVVLRFERDSHWLLPTIELLVGVCLLAIALTCFIQSQRGKLDVEPSARMRESLRLSNYRLFTLGALLVMAQSIVDVVFVVAMVRIGQLQLTVLQLITAVIVYAIAALFLQALVVVVFWLAPTQRKTEILRTVHMLLERYATWALIIVSAGLSALLFVLATLQFD
ncbi:MAG TPA: GAP family protein [Candidatus Saccharimonadales bacterium]|nr:GAP family protein [Candidatus Saccharimonadales bacterium]